MSDRRRHRAFAFAVLLAAVVCLLVWLFERPRSDDATGGTVTGRSRALVLGAETPAPSTQEASAARLPRRAVGALPEEAAIVAAARRFTAAFLEYEVGRLPLSTRRTIQSTATLSFASSLLSAPPRIPAGVRPPPPARLRSVALANGPEAGRAAVAVELWAADGRISSLTELLLRTGREWRISGLG